MTDRPRIPELAYEAYARFAGRIPADQPAPTLSYEEALEHQRGDLLGDLFVIELWEGLRHTGRVVTPRALDEAIALIQRARDASCAVERILLARRGTS